VLGVAGGDIAQACECEIRSGVTLSHRLGLYSEQPLKLSHCLGVCERLREFLGRNSRVLGPSGSAAIWSVTPLRSCFISTSLMKSSLPPKTPTEIHYRGRLQDTRNSRVHPFGRRLNPGIRLSAEGGLDIDLCPALKYPDFESRDRKPIAVLRSKSSADVKFPTVSPASNNRPFQRAFTQRVVGMGASVFHGVDFALHAEKADVNPVNLYAKPTAVGYIVSFRGSLIGQLGAFAQWAFRSLRERTSNAFSSARRLPLSAVAERYGPQP